MNRFFRISGLRINQHLSARSIVRSPFMPISDIESNQPQLYKSVDKLDVPPPIYGGRRTVSMLSGTGVGPELMGHVKDIFAYLKAPIDFEHITVKSAKDVDEAIISIKRNKVSINSNIEYVADDINDGSPNTTLRRELDLYINIVQCKPYCGLSNAKHDGVDVVMVRQNIEGEYAMLEHESGAGVIESLKVITTKNSRRLAKLTFDLATKYNRKRVTIVHKANIQKLSDGLFLRQIRDVGTQYPSIKQDEMIVDNCCMQLVMKPRQFDVLIMPNLYGSIITNIVCGILGGPGIFAGCNFGDDCALFEPANRSIGMAIVGKNLVNPVAMLNASIALLYYLRLDIHAQLLDQALFKTICKDNVQTPDIGGQHGTTDVIEQLKKNIAYYR